MNIEYLLICDGTSDRALLPIINHVLNKYFPDADIRAEWADFRHLLRKPKGLAEKIKTAFDLYEINWIFIHRDAENENIPKREAEVKEALESLPLALQSKVFVTLIPVKMMESWLLVDEMAIRKAAGNPNGKETLNLPRLRDIERVAAKEMLFQLLKTASGLSGRRLEKFNPLERRYLVTEYLEKFEELEKLSAFQYFQQQVEQVQRRLMQPGN